MRPNTFKAALIKSGLAASVLLLASGVSFGQTTPQAVNLIAAPTSVTDPALSRPADVDSLVADSRRARAELGWKPAVDFRGLVRMMVEADVALVAREKTRDPEERRLMVTGPAASRR